MAQLALVGPRLNASSSERPYTKAISRSTSTDRPRLPSLVWFLGSASLIGLAWFLRVGDERQVLLPWTNWPLPELCTFRRQLSMDCPGCGLTRSFIHLVHGDIASAWKLNWVGVIIFGYTLAQPPLALLHWAGLQEQSGPAGNLARRLMVLNQYLLIGLAILLIARWISLWITGDIFG